MGGFYQRLFNFRQIRFFDIAGRYTGLFSKALTSPDGKIRIPINESADEKSQIEEYIKATGARASSTSPAAAATSTRPRDLARPWSGIHAGTTGHLLRQVDERCPTTANRWSACATWVC